MKFLTYCVAIYTLFNMVACGKKEMAIDDRVERLESRAQYKCIDGVLYTRLGGELWIENGKKCVVTP